MTRRCCVLLTVAAAAGLLGGCLGSQTGDSAPAAGAAPPKDEKVYPVGYDDTPKLPHAPWRVHDIRRPSPPVVTPGATAADPPSDAIVLFDGTNLDAWQKKDGSPAQWKVAHGCMEVTPTGNIYTKQHFGDCQLHLEYQTPNPPQSNSQHRGNSGIFFFDMYEIQVLDCYKNPTYADGMIGAVYGQYPPLVNAARRPGQWHAYDILFTAPRFEGNKLASPAFVTVLLNGVVVQNRTKLIGRTTHRKVGTYKPHGPKGPIRLQDHNDKQPVRFRNIWVREL